MFLSLFVKSCVDDAFLLLINLWPSYFKFVLSANIQFDEEGKEKYGTNFPAVQCTEIPVNFNDCSVYRAFCKL